MRAKIKVAVGFLLAIALSACSESKRSGRASPPSHELEVGSIRAEFCLGEDDRFEVPYFLNASRQRRGEALPLSLGSVHVQMAFRSANSMVCGEPGGYLDDVLKNENGTVFISDNCSREIKAKYSKDKKIVHERYSEIEAPETTILAETVVICGRYAKSNQRLRVLAHQVVLSGIDIDVRSERWGWLSLTTNFLNLSGQNTIKATSVGSRIGNGGFSLDVSAAEAIWVEENAFLNLVTSATDF